MSLLIGVIPHCGVQILLKCKRCQKEKKKRVEQRHGMQPIAVMKADVDHDTLDQAVQCAWLALPSFSPSFHISLTLDHSVQGSAQRKGLAGEKIDNKGFKASELPTAKLLSRQRGARLS